MFLKSNDKQRLFCDLETIGLKKAINKENTLIKINLSGTYTKNHPRTDITLLKTIVNYIYHNGGKCAITEGSNGFLTKNLTASGLEDILKHYCIKVIDVDLEDYDEVFSYGEYHYIPKCFQDYPVRIAIPATSKRESMIYSNNIKLFVGAVPRKMSQLDEVTVNKDVPRPKLHQNIHLSVSNLFLAIKSYSIFQFYVNGGLSYNENIGEFVLPETFVGDDALELDLHIFRTFFSDCEYPDYLDIMKSRLSNDNIMERSR
jgi:hypothetical protein